MKHLKKKLTLIIGKKQIIIVALLFTLSLAAFLNWQFASTDQAITVMDVSENSTKKNEKQKEKQTKEKTQTYGEAELVSKNEDKKRNSYIKQAKLDRDTAYDEATENNNKILSYQNLTQEERAKIIEQSLQLNEKKNQIESIESQIKNKDFINDCVVYIENSKINAIIKTDKSKSNLTSEQIAQIKEIICGVTKFSASDIVITPTE